MSSDARQPVVRRKRQTDVASLIVPRSLITALLIVAGIWLSEALPLAAAYSIPLTAALLVTSCLSRRWQHTRIETLSLLLAVVGLGASWWTYRNSVDVGQAIGVLVREDRIHANTAIRLIADVTNIPALDTVSDSQQMSGPAQPRTMCLVAAQFLLQGDTQRPVCGTCRVMIQGDATTQLRWGDRVELTGRIALAQPPLNPGEFDYARHLRRVGISAMIFLKHPAAAKIVEPVSRWHPRLWLTDVRQEIVELMKLHLSHANRATAEELLLGSRSRATAEALLLGNRGHMEPELERAYISSGTIHLLAISGLHVGILYVFLVRMLNLLLIPRTQALILAGLVCVFYTFLTDLRPSVMRATVFILLHIVGQVLYRDLKMGSLIGATTLLLILFDPSIAFDVGAWLSFLAVGALGWVSDRTPVPVDRPAPPDAPTWQDRLRDVRVWLRGKLRISYRQILAVTLLAAPLVATQFHLVSLTGMVINILLIPFTTATLIVGYLFVATGLSFPPAAAIFGVPFNWLLTGLNDSVEASAGWSYGFVSIPDLPAWFLAAYYVLLLSSAMVSRSVMRQSLRLVLLTLVTMQFWWVCRTPDCHGLTCTVLSVGHGNAVVVETPDDKVLLFDAGALHRGNRTADQISRFLWHKGHRMIDAIVISHADADHYNAISGLLARMPVGQIVMTTEFLRSEAVEIQQVITEIDELGIPVTLAMNRDCISLGDCRTEFLKAELTDLAKSNDNEASLVAVLSYRGMRICLPGDLEGEGQRRLMSAFPTCQFVVCPHHGSLNSNNVELAKTLQPETVAVSCDDDLRIKSRIQLQEIYSGASVLFASRCGAVTLHIPDEGEPVVETFVDLEAR